MPDGEIYAAVEFVRGLVVDPDLASRTDTELLKRFLADRDETAFEALVWRHGPMVLALCRRILRDPQDAEDAFQASFLGYSRDLVITSALDENGKLAPVYVRSSSVRVFRADAGVDDFTKSGGLHWRFHDKTGKVRLPSAGEIVMIVREGSSHSSHSATRRPCAGRGRIAALSRLR